MIDLGSGVGSAYGPPIQTNTGSILVVIPSVLEIWEGLGPLNLLKPLLIRRLFYTLSHFLFPCMGLKELSVPK